ncbi:hypothetical protein GCM10010365_52840 [Streptomyces poonensis]|uniref:Uncharacterized protein n=1 Tax=Streptomyces poonensis TaxID=68255 RepID=A0A918PYW6_9ACTN|nr:hypothetical protein GCM10010365_52840 [Streptomyces poonensis]GLJ89052.1 hypothetical protein GCM10017589_16520 [Streptomyces poonensis]
MYGSAHSAPTGTATSAPSASPLTTRFAGKEAETTAFAVKRLDWMTGHTGAGHDQSAPMY